MKKLLIMICLPIILIGGCTGSPMSLNMMSPEELQQYDNIPLLCAAYGFSQTPKIYNELKRRQIFTLEEWQRITKKTFYIGDSDLLLLASRGNPTGGYNRTVMQFGTYDQWLYGSLYNPTYVYLENGIITGWQN